jgi:hypothetical protein
MSSWVTSVGMGCVRLNSTSESADDWFGGIWTFSIYECTAKENAALALSSGVAGEREGSGKSVTVISARNSIDKSQEIREASNLKERPRS